jgi:hypothetical protein
VLSRLANAPLQTPQAFKERFGGYRQLVLQSCTDLMNFWSREEFQKNNISLDIYLYNEFPFVYCYLIEDGGIYWGPFTWDEHVEDFNGPSNPCYFIDPSSEIYSDFHSWLMSRIEFYRLTATPMRVHADQAFH